MNTLVKEKTTSIDSELTHTPQSETPTHEEIAKRAYLLWEQDGRKDGDADGYWIQAEQECSESKI